jgi:tRNA pseudouridine38-40 synthase
VVARFRATLAYDGRAYVGFQRQAGELATIQGTLEAALLTITGQTVTIIGAGRTDTGVHAEGQVIAFDVDWRHGDAVLLRALNATLPPDIALQDIRQQAGFHPRFDAEARLYRYTLVQAAQRQPLWRQQAWQITHDLDAEALAAAADLLVGEHDFAAFGKPPQGTSTTRTVYRSAWAAQRMPFGWLWLYHIEANAFLQHMVRRIVGVLVEVGRGNIRHEAVATALTNGVMMNGVTLAPPEGLVLEAVRYPDDVTLLSKRGRRPPEEWNDE